MLQTKLEMLIVREATIGVHASMELSKVGLGKAKLRGYLVEPEKLLIVLIGT